MPEGEFVPVVVALNTCAWDVPPGHTLTVRWGCHRRVCVALRTGSVLRVAGWGAMRACFCAPWSWFGMGILCGPSPPPTPPPPHPPPSPPPL
jgi:hypothetical protein